MLLSFTTKESEKMNFYQCFKNAFRTLCFISVCSMSFVWLNKFLMNEDLCLVDYKPFESGDEEINLPDISLCFIDPFIDERLRQLQTNESAYRNHLNGKYFDETLTKIDYRHVTIDLKEFFIGAYFTYSNGSSQKFSEMDIQSNFNGFYYDADLFMKCFLVTSKTIDRNLRFLSLLFKLDLLPYWKKNGYNKVIAKPHHKNQFYLQDALEYIGFEKNENGFTVGLIISKVEVLRRRNTGKNVCLKKYTDWDKSVFEEQARSISCVAPYHEYYKNFSNCNNEGNFKRWLNFTRTVRKLNSDNLPCQTMPRIDFNVMHDIYSNNNNTIQISIGYPDEFKIITQSRAVGIGALIGNIGGYIGLFLGNLKIYNEFGRVRLCFH